MRADIDMAAGHASLEVIREQLLRTVTRTITLAVTVAGLGGILLNIALAMIPGQDPHVRMTRMVSGLILTLAAAGALLIGRKWGPRMAVAFFSLVAYVIVMVTAVQLGTGVGSSSAAVPAVIIVILGFVMGPRASQWATRVAVMGMLCMLALQGWGVIPGLNGGNIPPAAAYAVVLIIVFMVIGAVITHFSRIFWESMETIERARDDLQKKVELLEQTQIELHASQQRLSDHKAHLEEQVRERTAKLTQQELRLAAIIEALPVSLSIKDPQGRYLLCNKLFEQATGLLKEQLIGHRAQDLFPVGMIEQISQHDQALINGTPEVSYELNRTRRDGTQVDYLITKVPLQDTHGAAEGILTLAVNISDQKKLQRELATAKNEAEHLASVKTSFLANMSHEIRTPLHGVLGLAQVGQQLPPCDPQLQPILERITRSGRHLLGVINDILDFTKIDAGKLTIDRVALDPRQLAEDITAMMEARAQDKGLTLRLQCETPPAAVMGDALRIRQILINLVSNSIKFTAQGHVTLTVSTVNQQLRFAVQDTGIGLHPDVQARIFSPFEQADGSTSRRFGGTGLGLSISQQLARLMGGDILLTSALGEGATFTLVLPLEEADRSQLPHTPQATSHPIEQGARLKGLRIMAVDDVEINRDIITGLLTQQHAEVHCLADGSQALQLAKQCGPGYFDIVLMDVQMPGMNGMQATELLHMVDPGLPVLALTAHATHEDAKRCADVGMVGHLPKPFETQDMLQLILRFTRRAPLPVSVSADSKRPAAESTPPAPGSALDRGIDLAGALKRCGGQDALLRKLIGRFCDEQADFGARCRRLTQDDPEQARRTAHMLKGTVGNLGMSVLASQAGALEDALTTQHHGDQIATALRTLEQSIDDHLRVLRSWLNQAPVS
jgi:PAS domain S-box-containing protein